MILIVLVAISGDKPVFSVPLTYNITIHSPLNISALLSSFSSMGLGPFDEKVAPIKTQINVNRKNFISKIHIMYCKNLLAGIAKCL